MSRRFSDEPIHIIRRIPSPEQLSAVRPAKRPIGQTLVEMGAECIRRIADLLSKVMRLGSAKHSEAIEPPSIEPVAAVGAGEDMTAVPCREAEGPDTMSVSVPVQAPRTGVGVQPEEIAELRAFLLAQQQDIARLSAQIHELKALVVSQQQVLVYLGQELESNALASASGVAAGPGKRGRPARERPGKEKTVPRKDSSASSSLSL